MAAAGSAKEHNPRRILPVSFARLKRKGRAAENQRANGAIRLWAGGHNSERLWGSGLQAPKRNQSGQRPLSPLPPSPKYPSNKES